MSVFGVHEVLNFQGAKLVITLCFLKNSRKLYGKLFTNSLSSVDNYELFYLVRYSYLFLFLCDTS